MKISILQGAFLPVPPVRGGAVEKIWLALGAEFARLGHDVVHVSRLCDGLPREETSQGVRHRRVPGFDPPATLWRLKWRDYLYTRRARLVLPPSDIVVTNTFWAPVLLDPVRHGAIWVHVQRYPCGQTRFYRKAACLQAVSSVIASALYRECPRWAARIRTISNPLPPVAPAARAVRRNPSLILFVGRLHPEKGVELLVRAMAMLRQQRPGVRLRIVGPWKTHLGGGGSEFFLRLSSLAAPLGNAVEFVGPVFDEAALSAHYEEAAVFVYPSLAARGEASPVAPLEALAHGLPVVTSDLACFDDYLSEGVYVKRFNHRAATAAARLAGVLDSVLARPEQAPEIAAQARAQAARFSVARIAQEYLDGFQAVLGKARRTVPTQG